MYKRVSIAKTQLHV